jgi:hypothetical protein
MTTPQDVDPTPVPAKEELADDSLDNVVGGDLQQNTAFMGVRPPK